MSIYILAAYWLSNESQRVVEYGLVELFAILLGPYSRCLVIQIQTTRYSMLMTMIVSLHSIFV